MYTYSKWCDCTECCRVPGKKMCPNKNYFFNSIAQKQHGVHKSIMRLTGISFPSYTEVVDKHHV